MPKILRKIKKTRWYGADKIDWLAEGEIQAEALADLQTQSNILSVWIVEDNESNLGRVVAALAATCGSKTIVDYVTIDQKRIEDIGLLMKQTNGDSPDRTANSEWHRDLLQLTVNGVAALVAELSANGERNRMTWPKVKAEIQKSVDAGYISLNDIAAEDLRKYFEPK